MDRCNLFAATALVAALITPTIANSALVGGLADADGNYQAYYDTEAGLTWLAGANAGVDTEYDIDGSDPLLGPGDMTWENANAWAANLNINGVTGWRLPYAPQPDQACDIDSQGVSVGFGCTGNELGNLYFNVLENNSSLTNPGPFQNIQENGYWLQARYSHREDGAMYFMMDSGYLYPDTLSHFYAWAVHDGDVGTISAVPIPPSVFLFLVA